MNEDLNNVKNILNFDKINKAAKKINVEENEVEVLNQDGSSAIPGSSSGKKRGRPKKENSEVAKNTFIPMCQTNDPYEQTYNESMNMIHSSIMQIDQLSSEVTEEIENIRKSKTLKSKYTYISNLADVASSLITTKLNAIKEKNSIITNCHKLEMQRAKEIKDSKVNQDDDKYLADLYNAYINTPISQGTPTPLSLTANAAINNIPMMSNATSLMPEGGLSTDSSDMTPEQNRMLLEGNPNIETVVVYDQATGNKMFDVIDTTTGQPVPNYPRPPQDFLADTNINFGTGIASNSNLGQTWKVVVLGDPLAAF